MMLRLKSKLLFVSILCVVVLSVLVAQAVPVITATSSTTTKTTTTAKPTHTTVIGVSPKQGLQGQTLSVTIGGS
jgi:flagellar basal body-associated protein FliL